MFGWKLEEDESGRLLMRVMMRRSDIWRRLRTLLILEVLS